MIVDVVHRIDAKIDIIIDLKHGNRKDGDAGPGDREQGDAGHEPEAAGTSAGVPAARSRPSGPGS